MRRRSLWGLRGAAKERPLASLSSMPDDRDLDRPSSNGEKAASSCSSFYTRIVLTDLLDAAAAATAFRTPATLQRHGISMEEWKAFIMQLRPLAVRVQRSEALSTHIGWTIGMVYAVGNFGLAVTPVEYLLGHVIGEHYDGPGSIGDKYWMFAIALYSSFCMLYVALNGFYDWVIWTRQWQLDELRATCRAYQDSVLSSRGLTLECDYVRSTESVQTIVSSLVQGGPGFSIYIYSVPPIRSDSDPTTNSAHDFRGSSYTDSGYRRILLQGPSRRCAIAPAIPLSHLESMDSLAAVIGSSLPLPPRLEAAHVVWNKFWMELISWSKAFMWSSPCYPTLVSAQWFLTIALFCAIKIYWWEAVNILLLVNVIVWILVVYGTRRVSSARRQRYKLLDDHVQELALLCRHGGDYSNVDLGGTSRSSSTGSSEPPVDDFGVYIEYRLVFCYNGPFAKSQEALYLFVFYTATSSDEIVPAGSFL